MRCAVVDLDANVVVNVIDYQSVPIGCPPGFEGNKIAVASDEASPAWKWDAQAKKCFDPNPPAQAQPSRRSVFKSVIVARLQAAGKLAAASTALNLDIYARERWY